MTDGRACSMTTTRRRAASTEAAPARAARTIPAGMGAAGRKAWWRRFLHAAGNVPSLLAGMVLFFLMVMTFLDVLLRSTINNPIESATELTRLALAVIVFSSLPAVSYKGEHIVVDLLEGYMGPWLRRILDLLVNVVSGVALLWPAMRVWQLAERTREYGDVTEYLNIPQFYIALFIAVMTFATALAFIARGIVLFIDPDAIGPYRSPDNPAYTPPED